MSKIVCCLSGVGKSCMCVLVVIKSCMCAHVVIKSCMCVLVVIKSCVCTCRKKGGAFLMLTCEKITCACKNADFPLFCG